MKVPVGTYNQEKALVGVFSVIVQPVVEPMEHYTALTVTLVTGSGMMALHLDAMGEISIALKCDNCGELLRHGAITIGQMVFNV